MAVIGGHGWLGRAVVAEARRRHMTVTIVSRRPGPDFSTSNGHGRAAGLGDGRADRICDRSGLGHHDLRHAGYLALDQHRPATNQHQRHRLGTGLHAVDRVGKEAVDFHDSRLDQRRIKTGEERLVAHLRVAGVV